MIGQIFKGVFDTDTTRVIAVSDFLLCIGCAILIGGLMALAYAYRSRYTKSFLVTLLLLPSVVCVVIMMVNGNVGAGVAVAGAFSLVRFRSVPGTAKEITMLFLAMGAGLVTGMGYLAYALLFTLIMCLFVFVYSRFGFGVGKLAQTHKTLSVTIPEDLDYTGVFDEIFARYAKSYELTRVKTTAMGSLFRLTYDVVLLDPEKEKEMLDAIRVRNGNLEIALSRQENSTSEL
ncbi:MAG: DUF4956 domain-containing protein [Clostridia bacterium]|nr:DUF4956 domain-containing protein [Clostridia bacterium]